MQAGIEVAQANHTIAVCVVLYGVVFLAVHRNCDLVADRLDLKIVPLGRVDLEGVVVHNGAPAILDVASFQAAGFFAGCCPCIVVDAGNITVLVVLSHVKVGAAEDIASVRLHILANVQFYLRLDHIVVPCGVAVNHLFARSVLQREDVVLHREIAADDVPAVQASVGEVLFIDELILDLDIVEGGRAAQNGQARLAVAKFVNPCNEDCFVAAVHIRRGRCC